MKPSIVNKDFFLATAAALAAATIAVTGVVANTNTTGTTPGAPMNMDNPAAANFSTYVQGLKALNYTYLAGLLMNNTDLAMGFMSLGTQNVTLLAPTDKAFMGAAKRLGKLSKSDLQALIMYHVVNGSYPTDEASGLFNGTEHTIAQTLLGNKSYVDFGPYSNRTQVVVLSRDSKGFPVVVQNTGNVTFSSKDQTLASGNFRLAGIDDVLTIPGKFSQVIGDLKLKGILAALKIVNTTQQMDMFHGATAFVPVDAAFAAIQKQLQSSVNTTALRGILAGHALNGTVIYSSDFRKTAESMMTSMSSSGGSNNMTEAMSLGNLTAAGGQMIEIKQLPNGTYTLTSANSTANIVSFDHPFMGGVAHLIDGVLLNPMTNETAAEMAYAQYTNASAQNPLPTDPGSANGIDGATTPGAGGNSTDGHNAAGGRRKTDVDTGVVSAIILALSLAGGIALLL